MGIFDRRQRDIDNSDPAFQYAQSLDPNRRKEMIKELQERISQRQRGTLGQTIQGVGGIMSQGKGFTVDPTTGTVGAVDVSAGQGKQPSPMDELIQLEKYKALKEKREEAQKERDITKATLKAKYGVTDTTEPKLDTPPDSQLEPQPELRPEPIPPDTGLATKPPEPRLPTGDMAIAPPFPKKKIPVIVDGEIVGETENLQFDEQMEARKQWEKRQDIGEEGEKKEKIKWSEEKAERQIKFDIMDPKLSYFMDVGGRAYTELKNVADEFGVDLNFEEGGIDAWKSMLFKAGATRAKLAPLMVALDRLRPELGFEIMRQIGPFRATRAAEKFERTVAQFSGDIREDIANMTTTMAKNVANIELLDESGKRVSTEETVRRMKTAEATMVRRYNQLYRGMGITTKPYTSGYSLEEIAGLSNYSDTEENIIQNAMDDNPGYNRIEITSELIKKGIL